MENFRKGFERLLYCQLQTFDTKILDFFDEAPLSIFSFNCQSLKAHAPDLEDSITQKCSVLLLCDTLFSNGETVNIKNFTVISQYERPKCTYYIYFVYLIVPGEYK